MGIRRTSGPTVTAIFALLVAASSTSARSQTLEENAALCGGPNPDVRIKACTELLSDNIWPSKAHAYSNRGLTYDDLGQPQRAIEDFANAIKTDPKSAGAYNNRCYVLAKIGRPKEAISDCEEALKLAPGDGHMLDSLGYVHFRLGQYSQAINNYNAALEAEPDLATSLYARGVAKGMLGDAQGNNDIRAAVLIDKTIADRMAKIGVTLQTVPLTVALSR
jgi:tetratricopeptide (TPR) repeat protein